MKLNAEENSFLSGTRCSSGRTLVVRWVVMSISFQSVWCADKESLAARVAHIVAATGSFFQLLSEPLPFDVLYP